MKRFLFALLACLLISILSTASTHAQSTEWVQWISDNTSGSLNAICRDNIDNVYVTGRIGPGGQVDGNAIGVLGSYDMYLIKFNSAGEFQWSQRGGGGSLQNPSEGDSGGDVVYDTISNAVYVCGIYEGYPATFGEGIGFSGKGAFLAKYNTDGECLWVRRTDHGAAGSVHVVPTGDIVVTGGGVVGTGFPPPPDSITFFAYPDIRIATSPFVAKYSTNGDLLWAKSMGRDVVLWASSNNDRTLVFGRTVGPTPELLGAAIPLGTATNVGIVAQTDPAFTQLEWVRHFESPVLSLVTDHAFVENGDHVISGFFKDSLHFSTDTLIGPAGEYRPFIARFDSAGMEDQWALDIGTTSTRAPRVSRFTDGTLAFAGSFVDSVRVGGQTFHAGSETDFFLARMGTDGNLISAVNNGPVTMSSMDVVAMSDGGVVLGSTFSGIIDLGDGHVLTGGADIFVAKFGGFTGVPSLKTSASGELYIYANPNNGTCTIEMPEDLLYEHDLVLRILDLQGRLVQQSALRMNEGLIQLDIRAQATGTYVAEVGNGKVRYTGVIVFE